MYCPCFVLPLLQDAEAEDPDSYTPFQFMLQFMLQPLLVASGTTPAGHMAPAIIKMCRTLKRTADTAVGRRFITLNYSHMQHCVRYQRPAGCASIKHLALRLVATYTVPAALGSDMPPRAL